MSNGDKKNEVTNSSKIKVSAWSEAAGAGAFAGAIVGILAAHGGGKLGFGGFVVFLLFISTIKPWSRKALAILVFIVVGSFCAVLFRR